MNGSKRKSLTDLLTEKAELEKIRNQLICQISTMEREYKHMKELVSAS